MYYHGTHINHPSTGLLHTFWVYPHKDLLTHSLGGSFNRWDTLIPAKMYCNNHVYIENAGRLKKYVCAGHTNIADMALAQSDWKARRVPPFPLIASPIPDGWNPVRAKTEVRRAEALRMGDILKSVKLSIILDEMMNDDNASGLNIISTLDKNTENTGDSGINEDIVNIKQRLDCIEQRLVSLSKNEGTIHISERGTDALNIYLCLQSLLFLLIGTYYFIYNKWAKNVMNENLLSG